MSKKKNLYSDCAVEVALLRSDIEAILNALSVIESAAAATTQGRYAASLKKKILTYGRTYVHEGEEKATVLFFSNEIGKLIKLLGLYLNIVDQPQTAYYSQIGKHRKEVGL
ncbi:MAG: hypothetical protein K6E36_01655 [Oscillospiraceae bacterium]|nr:hypothetical protein [Oscillospiraceae bacterium]